MKDLGLHFLEQSRAFLRGEYLPKIRMAVEAVPEDRLWWRANASSNSIGNLILHLAGNARQWIVAGVGGAADVRRRQAEFDATEGMDKRSLIEHLAQTIGDVDATLQRIDPADLFAPRTIQGEETTVFDAIYHVVEHFSGHTGQIILLAKQLAPGQLRYYEATERFFRPLWTPEP